MLPASCAPAALMKYRVTPQSPSPAPARCHGQSRRAYPAPASRSAQSTPPQRPPDSPHLPSPILSIVRLELRMNHRGTESTETRGEKDGITAKPPRAPIMRL